MPWGGGGVAPHRSRHRGGGAAEKNYRLDNRANIKEMQAQNRQARTLGCALSAAAASYVHMYPES